MRHFRVRTCSRGFSKTQKEGMETWRKDKSVVFVDSNHVKARANSQKNEDLNIEVMVGDTAHKTRAIACLI